MYSTKVWDIRARTSDRYAYVGPGTRTLDTPDCYPNTGYSGFQVDVTRVSASTANRPSTTGEVPHAYTPGDTVICRPPGSLDTTTLVEAKRRSLVE